MDGTFLAGRAVRVNISGTQGSHQLPQPHLQPRLNEARAAAAGYNTTAGLAIGPTASMMQNDANAVTNLDGLDTDGKAGGGEKINAAQRSNLMMKLASSAGMEVPEGTRKAAAQGGAYGGSASMPTDYAAADSRCVVLKNMFDRLAEEVSSNPKFFEELAEDVRGECARLGTVLYCGADKWSNGFVYIKMLANAEASRVLDTMHGRYFAKNKILAAYVPEETLDKKFKLRK